MKVLLVNGSPNEHGCTDAALHIVAESLRACGVQTEFYWIGKGPVGGCTACRGCRTLGKCAISDGVNEFAEKAKTADGFIFGSPVHYAAASGNLTCFMDRLFFAHKPIFRMKPAAAVFSARRAGTTAAFDQLNKYFTICEMPIVSSSYWNMVHGSVAEDVAKGEEGCACMRQLGKNMAYLLACMRAGKEKGITLPEVVSEVRTNFIR